MKKLLLNRHAEAASPKGTDDFDRPLTENGRSQAEALAAKLQQNHILPKYWLYSTALRANTTANIITNALNIQLTEAYPAIYEASEETLLNIINRLPEKHQFAAITGHNPGIAYLFNALCNEVRDVPPCTALLIEFDVESWAHISADTGCLKWYNAP